MPRVLNVETIVRDIVRARAPHAELSDDAAFGSDGLGLDSISMAEVLLDCEERFGVDVTDLLEQEPLTLRRLIAHISAEVRQETPA
jgi:acyl carrier protein